MSPQDQLIRERIRQMRAEMESLDRQVQFKAAQEARIRASVSELPAAHRIDSRNRVRMGVALARLRNAADRIQATARRSPRTRRSPSIWSGARSASNSVCSTRHAIPERPISPARWQINAIGAAVGLLLGLLIVALLELLDSSFRSESDFTTVMNVPVLAQVPLVVTQGDLNKQRHRRMVYSTVGIVALFAAGVGAWALHLWRYIV